MSRNSSPAQHRRQRKAALETRIEQQRIDMLVDAHRWHDASRSIDDVWHEAMRWKAPIYAISGLVLWRGVKNRNTLLRYGRRGFTVWMLMKRMRKLLG
ncbi:YqjK family protein [Aidingimonas lacisalsi]|uniref:YqjK family protein n=1 Tax=Aidingimonas lacisalsi TaxID=2604086 RepID=UPI0011D202E1|nr:YqjK family protein [Aidingimonas lacisalsi]